VLISVVESVLVYRTGKIRYL